jgi:hypothetical protein
MEEFLFVLHDLGAREFNLDVADEVNASIQFDRNVVVYSLQVGQLI